MLAIICFGLISNGINMNLCDYRYNSEWHSTYGSTHFRLIDEEVEGRSPDMDRDVDDWPVYDEI